MLVDETIIVQPPSSSAGTSVRRVFFDAKAGSRTATGLDNLGLGFENARSQHLALFVRCVWSVEGKWAESFRKTCDTTPSQTLSIV